jgi:hypothetical protein
MRESGFVRIATVIASEAVSTLKNRRAFLIRSVTKL